MLSKLETTTQINENCKGLISLDHMISLFFLFSKFKTNVIEFMKMMSYLVENQDTAPSATKSPLQELQPIHGKRGDGDDE